MEERITALEKKFQVLENFFLEMHKNQEAINQQTQKLINQLIEGDNILKKSLIECLENQAIIEQKVYDIMKG